MIQNEEFKSKYLNAIVKITVVTPKDLGSVKAVLILLHGSTDPEGDYSTFKRYPDELKLQELANSNGLIFVLPFMPMNSYYISSEGFDCDSFLADELLSHLSINFQFIPNTEKILAGISMGGYGAVLVGCHTRRFNRILSISGAFIQDDIIIGNQEICGQSTPDKIYETEPFLYHFAPINTLEESTERNVVQALQARAMSKQKPSIFLSCGTKDRMYTRNKAFENKLNELNYKNTFYSLEGEKHDFDCFRNGLQAGLNWLFQEDSKGEPI